MSVIILPCHLVITNQIDTLRVAGRGGKERDIAEVLLPSAKRASSPVYDYEIYDEKTNLLYRVEIKKQTNDQWFDIGKYYNLSESDREIVILLIKSHKRVNTNCSGYQTRNLA